MRIKIDLPFFCCFAVKIIYNVVTQVVTGIWFSTGAIRIVLAPPASRAERVVWDLQY